MPITTGYERLMNIKYKEMWGMEDPDRHMLFVITWKDSGKRLTKLASEKFLAKRAY